MCYKTTEKDRGKIILKFYLNNSNGTREDKRNELKHNSFPVNYHFSPPFVDRYNLTASGLGTITLLIYLSRNIMIWSILILLTSQCTDTKSVNYLKYLRKGITY